MSILPILHWPDPRLSEVCAPVTGDVAALAADMLDTMYDAKGRGLAAPQVGHMIRLFVMDVGWKEGAPDPVVMINPEVAPAAEGSVWGQEACLSIPGVAAELCRPGHVRVHWTDLEGARHDGVMTGFAARCVQHELDHLDGLVIFDRLSPERRKDLENAYGG
ncbi:peptide deformylase [Nioella nitratireducens]|uniref:peptide deformylase n=1 Tax=Nioella nitratireducens TaxID=1287720 RepID=UPI0008FD32F3|nr:peptide deformylase [Nioella nitratireducens]